MEVGDKVKTTAAKSNFEDCEYPGPFDIVGTIIKLPEPGSSFFKVKFPDPVGVQYLLGWEMVLEET